MNEFEREFYKLFREILDLVTRTEEEALLTGRFKNLSRSEMQTLQSIGLYETRSMGETAQILGVTTGTLTVQVDRLVRKGYVERRRRPEDRRVVELTLTREGKLACRMHTQFNRLLLRYILEPLDEDEKKLLYGSMRKVDRYLREKYRHYKEGERLKRGKRERADDFGSGD